MGKIVAIPLTRTGQRWIDVRDQTVRPAVGTEPPGVALDLVSKADGTFLSRGQQETMTREMKTQLRSATRGRKRWDIFGE